jgi:hypothetical protein
LTEKDGARDAVDAKLRETVRSHYDDLARIADDVRGLGYDGASAILRERLPRTKTARSGDLGEILGTELVEEHVGFQVPVRRLRYKDGREMALRGDDFLGVAIDEKDRLRLLKGEAKSRENLSKKVIAEARETLSRHHGRPTPSSLIFVADRLLDAEGAAGVLGRRLRDEVALRSVPAARIDHTLFTMSGNVPLAALTEDLTEADGGRRQTVINLHIVDHQEFIADLYDGALDLGDD